MTERQKLMARSRRLRSEMRALGPMIKGSVIFRKMRCGKPGCRCTRDEPHLYLCVVYRKGGKSKTVYVDKDKQGQALVWSRNYKRLKQLLDETILEPRHWPVPQEAGRSESDAGNRLTPGQLTLPRAPPE